MSPLEVERKFLVWEAPPELERRPSRAILQGYLAIEPDGTEVRLRRQDEYASLTVKRGGGRTRQELEIELTQAQFDRLWPLTEGRRVEKTRYVIGAGEGLVIELDLYSGTLAGLMAAEIEFADESAADAFEPPAWFGPEVTDDVTYKNQHLAVHGSPPTPRPRADA